MGVVVLQLGQGGNQMGHALFECLTSMSTSPPTEFFRTCSKSSLIARAVLVDMEPKVIEASMRKAKTSSAGKTPWMYSRLRQVTRESGSGNNWACGFYNYGPKCCELVLDAIRLEVEECDTFGGFITSQSMAGGTGAGLGAYLVDALHDEFPSSFILSHCIWPYESGEVIVQNYNALLTLSHLQGIVDGMVIVENEQLSAICRSSLGISRPSFDDMNEVAAQALAATLLPSHWRPLYANPSEVVAGAGHDDSSQVMHDTFCFEKPRVRLLSDLVSAVCAHPGHRLLTQRFTPHIPLQSLDFTTFTWEAQLKHLRQMLITGAHKEPEMDWSVSIPADMAKMHPNGTHSINRSLANLLILRGRGSEHIDVSGFADEKMYPIWSTDPLSVAATSTPLGKYEMAVSLLSNCQSSAVPAFKALSRAYTKYSSKAYLHQYFEHGMEASNFDGAFATTEDIIARYQTL